MDLKSLVRGEVPEMFGERDEGHEHFAFSSAEVLGALFGYMPCVGCS